ncbi:Mitochondrial ribosome-associated GTPase 1 [Armadillidium vulgare]|nr:Mitochondrial ribosome-associated GTPase 1 [Armadillidium vulgare]
MNFAKCKQVIKHGLMMRESFDFKSNTVTNWFPGHMGKGLNEVHKKLRDIDCLIEVHDARIPLSGRNPLFENEIAQIKPHILVLNKLDLVSKMEVAAITKYLEEKKKNFLFTNCKKPKSKEIKGLVPMALELIKESERYHRSELSEYGIMVIGIPNVGKSSLINALRVTYLNKGHATPVGAAPGITRAVLERIKVCDNPRVYVRDTPGILEPNIRNVEVGLKLALVNTITDHLVGETMIADYLLFRLNLIGIHKYVDFLRLDKPTDDIYEALGKFAEKEDCFDKRRNFGTGGGYIITPNYKMAAERFITAYRKGKFGSLMLDHYDYSVK